MHLSTGLMQTVKELAQLDAITGSKLQEKLKSDTKQNAQQKLIKASVQNEKKVEKKATQKAVSKPQSELFKSSSISSVMMPNYAGPIMLAQTSSSSQVEKKKDRESKHDKESHKKSTKDEMNDAFSAIAFADDEDTNKETSAEDKKGDSSLLQHKESMEQKTQINVEAKANNKTMLNKFEQEFVDKDDEDDSENAENKKKEVLMVDFSSMSEEEELLKRKILVEKNLA